MDDARVSGGSSMALLTYVGGSGSGGMDQALPIAVGPLVVEEVGVSATAEDPCAAGMSVAGCASEPPLAVAAAPIDIAAARTTLATSPSDTRDLTNPPVELVVSSLRFVVGWPWWAIAGPS